MADIPTLLGNTRFNRFHHAITPESITPESPLLANVRDVCFYNDPQDNTLQVRVGADGKPIAYMSPPGSPSAFSGTSHSDQGDGQTPQPTPQPVRAHTPNVADALLGQCSVSNDRTIVRRGKYRCFIMLRYSTHAKSCIHRPTPDCERSCACNPPNKPAHVAPTDVFGDNSVQVALQMYSIEKFLSRSVS